MEPTLKADLTKLDGTTTRDQKVSLAEVVKFLQNPDTACASIKSKGVEVVVYKDAGYGVTVGVETVTQEMAFREFKSQDHALRYMVLSLASR